ncbi:hypothetical protein CB1_000338034 [Camelus ferus]|nr:hypothetical protein CB1_000338034 [Camelus ferus]
MGINRMWYGMKPFPYPTLHPPEPWSPPPRRQRNREKKRPVDRKVMSDSLVVCEVDPELKEKLRKFRFRKETDNAAIIMKVDKDRQMVVLEEEFQVFEIRTTEDLTEAWLQEKLSFFR